MSGGTAAWIAAAGRPLTGRLRVPETSPCRTGR